MELTRNGPPIRRPKAKDPEMDLIVAEDYRFELESAIFSIED
jgi:hypothetical protein